MNKIVVLGGVLLAIFAASAQENPSVDKTQTPTSSVAAGKQTYLEYCAVCHGADGRGTGPAGSALRTPPADLTTLAKRHGGKFPEEYVANVLRFGKPFVSHGSADMPIWGPIFAQRDNGSAEAVRRRIKSLCDYLATLQEKES